MEKRSTDMFKGVVFTVVSAILFGLTPIVGSMSYALGSNPITLTFFRNGIAVPAAALLMVLTKASFRITRHEFFSLLFVGIVGKGITTLMLYSSYSQIGVGAATTLHFLYPVFVAIILRLFFGERLGKRKTVVLTIATAGSLLLLESGSIKLVGVLLAAASGLTYAVYIIGVERLSLKNIPMAKYAFYISLFASVFTVLADLPFHNIVFALPPKAFAYSAVVALGGSLLADPFFQQGIRYLRATSAAIFSLSEPITGNIAGWLFLNEAMGARKIFGSLTILGAVVAMVLLDYKGGSRICKKNTGSILAVGLMNCSVSKLKSNCDKQEEITNEGIHT